jgi:hypothetical protein
MISNRMKPDHVGCSIWPAGLTGFANLRNGRGCILVLAPLIGRLEVGDMRLECCAAGICPMPPAPGRMPTVYRFTHEADPARVVFCIE